MELRRSSRRKPLGKPVDKPTVTPSQAKLVPRKVKKIQGTRPLQKNVPAAILRRPPFRPSSEQAARKSSNNLLKLVDFEIVQSCNKKVSTIAKDRNHLKDSALHKLAQQLHSFIEAANELNSHEVTSHAQLLERIKKEVANSESKSSAAHADLLFAKVLTDTKITEEQSLTLLSKWHGIDMQDVADIAFLREKLKPKADRNARHRLELQCVNKKVSKSLLQERDNSLGWPEKKRGCLHPHRPQILTILLPTLRFCPDHGINCV
ncbi:LANO_0E09054g1_1 [Lachancea nothofagi CBS 11611]|uniref:LANO_0E09054g1_1 n=1 Tax=Lachancea nothofagi CBS 11611 TaxID=1266666 RepID=A0A1G4JVP1_9SACH|nr:LANO_0E09054g1_1 [Lachancea nothofagi CBS 11611]